MTALGRIGNILLGAIFIIMGVLAFFNPMDVLAGFAWLWAIMFVVSGIINVVMFIKCEAGTPGRGFILFNAIVQLILGFILLSNGLWYTTVVALIVMQIWLIFSGMESIVFSFELKRAGVQNWWLTLIFGILMLIIGLSTFSSAVFNTAMLAVMVSGGLVVCGAAFLTRGFAKTEQ